MDKYLWGVLTADGVKILTSDRSERVALIEVSLRASEFELIEIEHMMQLGGFAVSGRWAARVYDEALILEAPVIDRFGTHRRKAT